MKKYLLIICCFFLIGQAEAQQQGVFSNYLMGDYFFNPAIAGSKKVGILSLNYHHQWAGFKRAPINIAANYSGSVRGQGKHGYGATFVNTSSGLLNTTGFYLNYAYHVKLKDSLKMGFGIQPGYLMFRTKLYDATLADQGDEVLTGELYNANALDLNFGINLYSDKFFVMLSVEHLFTNWIKFTSYNQNLHYQFTGIGGYTFRFKKVPYFKLQPSVMIKYSKPTPVQVSAMLNFLFLDKYSLGLMWRDRDAFGVNVGVKLFNRLTLNYGYEFGISKFRSYNKGSHEVGLSFIVTKKKKNMEDQDEKLNKSILEEMNNKSKKK
jgi:type IX secretion system PorP/SprF family membrane protein